MIPFLVINVVGLCGFWVKRLKYFTRSPQNLGKVFDSSKNKDTNLASETFFSPTQDDRISELPDEILSYILSHLSVCDAGRLSTLSRRWRNIWLIMPKLNLEWCGISGYKGLNHDDDCELHKQTYLNRMEYILCCYEESNISSLDISFCFTKEYTNVVDHWLDFTANKCLETLSLRFICIWCPCSILKLWFQKRLDPVEWYSITDSYLSNFPYLKNLRLDFCVLKIPTDFRLNTLVRLDLNYVLIEGIDELQCMLSNSSTIERLRFRRCNLPGKLCVGDNLRRLSFLMINDCSNLVEIELNAMNLKTFEYVGAGNVEFSFLSVAKVEFSYVYLMHHTGGDRILSKFANFLPSLRTLFIRGMIPWIHNFPTYPSTLLRSVVKLRLVFMKDEHSDGIRQNIPHLLKSLPLLQKLNIMVPSPLLCERVELPPVYLHARLQEVEFCNFDMSWISCARYFLTSAIMLERLVITRHLVNYMGDGEWEKRGLGSFFSEKESEYIRNALQGCPTSLSADVIIN